MKVWLASTFSCPAPKKKRRREMCPVCRLCTISTTTALSSSLIAAQELQTLHVGLPDMMVILWGLFSTFAFSYWKNCSGEERCMGDHPLLWCTILTSKLLWQHGTLSWIFSSNVLLPPFMSLHTMLSACTVVSWFHAENWLLWCKSAFVFI